jgi:hypothetical protein
MRKLDLRVAAFFCAVCTLFGVGAHTQGGPAPLPEGNGLAAAFPNDAGIASNPNVIFADNFESYTSVGQLTSSGNYDAFWQGSNLAIDTATVFNGSKSMRMRMPQTGNEVANAIVKDLPPRDVIFMRAYWRFQPNYAGLDSSHNGMRVTGNYLGPGRRPNGRDFFLVNIENSKWGSEPEPGYTHAYVYHPEQDDIYGEHWFADGRTSNGAQSFGPFFQSRPSQAAARGVWLSIEIMVRMNTPGTRDGRIAVWQNGSLIADWVNVRFRDVNTVKIDQIQLENGGQGSTQPNDKWYDNLVIAGSYIGPMVTGQTQAPVAPTNLRIYQP